MKQLMIFLAFLFALSCDGQRHLKPENDIHISDKPAICINCETRAFSLTDSSVKVKKVFDNNDVVIKDTLSAFWKFSPAKFKVKLAFYHFLRNNAAKYDRNLMVYLSRRDTALFCYQQGIYNPDTPLPIMSATKAVTAAVIMKLVESEKLSLDDQVSQYIASFRNEKKSITIRQLLTHTSGLVVESRFDSRSDITLRQSVDSIALKTKLQFAPGTRSLYGSVGFSVASRIAEIVEKKTWAKIFEERIASKCGMKNAVYSPAHPSNPATGYGIVCSMNEYLRFMGMIYNKGIYNGNRVLNESSIAEMERDNTNNVDMTYGLGVFRFEIKGNVATEIVCQSAAGVHGWINREKNYYGLIFTQAGFDKTIQSNQDFRKLVREKL